MTAQDPLTTVNSLAVVRGTVAAKVTQDPASVTIAMAGEGVEATFRARAIGKPEPVVQWQVSTDAGSTWSDIEVRGDAEDYVLPVPDTTSDGNLYRAAFANPIETVASAPATLTVRDEVDVPDAPTSASGVAGNAVVDLTWLAPESDGGDAIIGYYVFTFIAGDKQQGFTGTGDDDLTFQMTGLDNDTTYTFTVAAYNAIGTGAESAPTGPLTPTAS